MAISRSKRFSKKAQGSIFGAAIAAGIEDPKNLQNAIEFIEGPSGIGIVLRPVQRVIVKAIYGVPFDWRPQWADRIEGWGKVPMYDVFRDKKLHPDVTEEEYLKITHSEGRGNVEDWRMIPGMGGNPGEAGFNEAVIFAGRRGGKALGIDEPIPTPDGFVRNGDLKDGDVVLSPSGKPIRVVHAHEPFLSEVYRVTFDDGTFVLTHPEHRWFTFTHKERRSINRRLERPVKAIAAAAGACACGGILEIAARPVEGRKFRREHFARPQITGKVRTTEEIRATLVSGSKVQTNHSVPLTKAVELPERDLPLDPYCLGAWLGDGRKIGSNGFSAADEDALETLQHFSAAGFPWKKSRWKQQWNIYGLTPVLRKMGLICNKHIPHEYLWASAAQRLALLQGLLDTDGYCAEDGQVEFCNTNKTLAEGVYHLAASLGLKPFWKEGVAKLYGRDCGPKYRVTWTGTLPIFRLGRKLARLPETTKATQNWRYIVSIEPAGKQIVRCITVDDPDGLFLFGKNFNVTHNSELVACVAAYKLYMLLNIKCPQDHFGLFPGSIIDFTFLAQDENGAHRLFKKLREQVLKAESFFGTYLKDANVKDLAFVTLSDREKGNITPTVTVSCLPCLEEHELIWSEQGLKEIRDVEVGERVLDKYGRKQYVTHKQNNQKELLALETANFRGDPLLLTPNHTCLFVPLEKAKAQLPYLGQRNRNGKIKEILKARTKRRFKKSFSGVDQAPASDIRVGDYMLFPRIPEDQRRLSMPYIGERPRSSKSAAQPIPALAVNPTLCRLWGLYLAEGSILKPAYRSINWDFHIKEWNTLAKFVQDTLASEYNLTSTLIRKGENGCRVMCHSTELVYQLKALFGTGCAAKSVPSEALFWTDSCQKALLQGWLEGDGCANRPVGPTVSKKLAYSLFALGVQAGLYPAVKHKKAYIGKDGTSHRESWCISFNKQERYYRFFQRIGEQEFYWSQVLRNEPSGKTGSVVDISVENTESFLTKMAAVHNCTTSAVRSPSSIFLALDEFAHFRSAKGSTSDDMYAAASPATADFHHDMKVEPDLLDQANIYAAGLPPAAAFEPMGTTFGEEPSIPTEEDDPVELGIQDSMILSISSPLKKIGKMYELHKMGLEEGIASGIFTLNVPSAEMNPKLLAKFLKSEYRKNPLTFRAEYGGKFLESSESYVTETAVKRCVACEWDEKGLPVAGTIRYNVTNFRVEAIGRQYFWGFDLGMSNDASALAIGHLEPGGPHGSIKLVYDYIDRMMVGETGEWAGVHAALPGQPPKYAGYQVLPLEDILDWLDAMNKCLPCFRGATDQHGGQQLVQLLGLKQINNVELVNLTPAINSQMAYALRGYIESERCSFPLVPKFIQELKLVELEVASKYQIRVAAPQEKGAHDDMADSAMLVAFLAQRWLMEQGNMMDPSGMSLMIQAQANKPPVPLLSLDGVSIQTLKVLEKLKTTEKHSNMYAGTSPVSPWHRRGRR